MRQYKDAYTLVPEETVARVEYALRHLPCREERTVFHRQPRMVLAIALALLLTLCGGAIAAERLGVLNFLFWGDTPTTEQLNLVQDVSLTQQTELATITVTDAVFDGRQLSVGLIFDTERPTYVLSSEVWVNDTLQANPSGGQHLGWLSKEEKTSQAIMGLSVTVEDNLVGQAAVQVRLTLLSPEKAIAHVSDESADIQQALTDGFTPVDANRWELAHLDDASLFSASPEDYATAYHMNMENVALDFTLNVDAVSHEDTVYLDVANNEELPFSVIVRRAELTPLGSHFMLDVYPKEGGIENPRDLAHCFPLSFAFYDETWKRVDFQSSMYYEGGGGWMRDENDQPFFRIVEENGPISSIPERLWLVYNSWNSNVSYWQWAIELRPAEAPTKRVSVLTKTATAQSLEDPRPFYVFAGAEALVMKDRLMCVASVDAREG